MRDALSFLTIVPVGARLRVPGRSALLAFPLVGLLIGIVWAVTAWAASTIWDPLVAAGLVVAVDLLLTGGLHADAIADLTDGIASRKSADEAIAVMREPTIGGVGAAVLVVGLILRFVLIALVISRRGFTPLIAVPVAGRFAMVWLMSRAGTAQGPSLASAFCEAATNCIAIIAGLVSFLVAWLTADIPGPTGVILAALVAEVAASFFRRRFGGLVGDAVGAVGFGAEAIGLAVLASRIG